MSTEGTTGEPILLGGQPHASNASADESLFGGWSVALQGGGVPTKQGVLLISL